MSIDGEGLGPRSLRRHNLALLMRLVAGSSPVSRVELAQRTGLTKATVSALVGELIKAGLVRDLGTEASGAPGRPAGRLALGTYGPIGIGLQLAADHVAGYLTDLAGRVQARELRRLAAAAMTPEEAVRAARPLLRRLFDHANTSGQLVAGIAVTVGGIVTRDADGYPRVAWAPELGWRDVDVLSLLGAELRALDLHVIDRSLDGEVAFAALAEQRATPDPQWAGALYVGGEAVIGAALLDGRGVHRGGFGAAGVLGHVPVRRRGDVCACGGRGCLELYAGRQAMAAAAGLPEPGPSRLLARDQFGALLADGDQGAALALDSAADALVRALLPACLLLDPTMIAIGGRLGALGAPLRDCIAGRLVRSGYGNGRPVPVRLGVLGPDAALRGAAGSVIDGVIADPLSWIET